MSYRELWLFSLPIYVAVSLAIMVALAHPRSGGTGKVPALVAGTGVIAALLFLVSAATAFAILDPNGDRASIEASGPAQVEQGDWHSDQFTLAPAQLKLVALERNQG